MNNTNINDFFNSGYVHSNKIVLDDNMDVFIEEGEIIENDASTSISEEDSDSEYTPKRFHSTRSNTDIESPFKKRKIEKNEKKDDVYTKKSAPKNYTHASYFSDILEDSPKIIGRESEAKQIITYLEQPLGGVRPLLIGSVGIGKQSVIAKTAILYQAQFKGLNFHGRKIFCIDCKYLVEKYNENGVIEALDTLIKQHLLNNKQQKPVFYFRDIEVLMRKESISDSMQLFFYQPFSFIASIGEDITDEKIQKVIKKLSNYNFILFPIKESPLDEICQIVQYHLLHEAKTCKIHYTDEAIDLAVKLSTKHITTRCLPQKAINAIQECGNSVLINNTIPKKQLVIDAIDVAKFFSSKTNIPYEDLLDASVFNQERFILKLKENIVGQDYAIKIVSERAATWKMGLLSPERPWGSFLFVGPTGVGKTELAKQLAKQLFKSVADILIFDGSEFKESHTLSNLIGAPRGYDGHDSGGMLTGPLLENPYRVILFDEFEKAHDEVRKLFLQALDQGRLTDRRGRVVDCTKALFIMTSNLGSTDDFNNSKVKPKTHNQMIESLKPILVKHLSAEMCGRFTAIVPFMPITKDQLYELAEVELNRIEGHLLLQAEIELYWTEELLTFFASMDVDLRFGGRQFCKLVNDQVTTTIKNMMTTQQKRVKGKLMLDVSAFNNSITVSLMK